MYVSKCSCICLCSCVCMYVYASIYMHVMGYTSNQQNVDFDGFNGDYAACNADLMGV